MPHLAELTAQNANLHDLQQLPRATVERLVYLDVSENNLTRLDALRGDRLRTLNVSNNRLELNAEIQLPQLQQIELFVLKNTPINPVNLCLKLAGDRASSRVQVTLQNDMLRFGNTKIDVRYATQDGTKLRAHMAVDGPRSGMQYEAVSIAIYQV